MIQSASRNRSIEWAEQKTANICKVVIESNLGINDQIIRNETNLLDLLTTEQLSQPDDLGVTPIYTAIYYDKPVMVKYLMDRGVDLSQPCDPAMYGNPMFYAVSMKRYHIVDLLDRSGYSVTQPCDCLDQLPLYHAQRIDDPLMVSLIQHCIQRPVAAAMLFMKHYLRRKCQKRYQMKLASIKLIQTTYRQWKSSSSSSLSLSFSDVNVQIHS